MTLQHSEETFPSVMVADARRHHGAVRLCHTIADSTVAHCPRRGGMATAAAEVGGRCLAICPQVHTAC
jgi:hypothetical protein